MKTKLLSFLFAIAASVGTLFASDTEVDGIWYNFDDVNLTAEVTYQGSSYTSQYSNVYTGDVVIPASVTYNEKTYSVTSIGEHAFEFRRNLTSIEIPNSATSIREYAFAFCGGLASVNIPDGVQIIGDYAFENCTTLTSVTIGYNVTNFGEQVFEGCSSLTSVVWNAKNCNDANFFLPNSVNSFTFGSEVERIPDGLCYCLSLLTSIEIPNSVTSIGGDAFYNCSSLTSINLPNSIISIGSYAFCGCDGLTSPLYNDHLFAFLPTSFSGEYIIPNGIEKIANSAFYNCKNITKVTIPNTVNSIGHDAFGMCENLTTVSIPQSVIEIGDAAFRYTGISSITIPSNVTVIPDYCFDCCENLVDITFNNDITSIEQFAFWMCKIEHLNLPSSLISIGAGAFGRCPIKNITIPSKVADICRNYNIFYDCDSLEYIIVDKNNTIYDSRNDCNAIIETSSNTLIAGCKHTIIPNTVAHINPFAFHELSNLTSIVIPNNITTIGQAAFGGCNGLRSITCEAVNPPLADPFSSTSIPLYVPAESVNAYKTADVWKDFTNILPIPANSVAITANEDPQHAGTYYSTFYYGSGNYELPATGVEAFVATVSGSDMNLTRIASEAGVIPQGTAVILKSTIQNYTLTLSEDAPVFEGTNALQGVDEATNTPSNCYVLSAVDGVVGFYQYTGEQVGAHKAYLVYNGAGAPRRMRFVFDEENAATGVEGAQSTDRSADGVQKRIENGQLIIEANGVLYNAQGQIVK